MGEYCCRIIHASVDIPKTNYHEYSGVDDATTYNCTYAKTQGK